MLKTKRILSKAVAILLTAAPVLCALPVSAFGVNLTQNSDRFYQIYTKQKSRDGVQQYIGNIFLLHASHLGEITEGNEDIISNFNNAGK